MSKQIIILALFITSLSHVTSQNNQNQTYLSFDDGSNETFNPCLVFFCPKGSECVIDKTYNIPLCACIHSCELYNKRKRKHICGSNGKLYTNACELYRDGCIQGKSILISDLNNCRNKQTCSAEEYAIMKDNLLLFHHQNLGYPQKDGPVHRMDYLVSIIFSHYDQNNDGLVEKDELVLMWKTVDIQRISNFSNCTLINLLYDDTNGDNVLTINEFNDAFHHILEMNKLHLDQSLSIVILNVHDGDNIVIKCDIIGVSAPNSIIWKRFGFEISKIKNDTDYDYEYHFSDEIRIADGELFIQNVQTKHSGNYTCQPSNNGMIVQTHIVIVHTPPVLFAFPKIQSKRPGEFVEMICHSVGEYVESLRWLKNDKILDLSDEAKYTLNGNGTYFKINQLSFADTGAYTCTSTSSSTIGHFSSVSNVIQVIIQNEPSAIEMNRDQKLFVFHSNGISIYSSTLCKLVHEIHSFDFIPGTENSICHHYARRCTWGQAVSVAENDLIYVTQPMMNRILVLSITQLIVIEAIQTDSTPLQLYHVPKNDQLWIVNFNLHRDGDGTIKVDPSKTIQMIPDVKLRISHRPIHPENVDDNKMEILNFYIPPVVHHRENFFDYKYGLVTYQKKRGFFKLDLNTLRYTNFVDLSIYDCVPEHIKFSGLYGFIIISCMELLTARQTGQIVLDYITNNIISIKADLIGIPYISPDSRHIITINHRHESVLISIQQVQINGLVFAFDVETTLNISDIAFVKSTNSLNFDVYASTDKPEILFLSLETGKVETIKNIGDPSMNYWFNDGRKIVDSALFSSLIASISRDAVYIISTRTKNITCEVGKLQYPKEIVWV